MYTPSYVSGPSSVPLLGETIGENLRRTVERFPDREALVSVQQGYRATYRELWEQTSEIARALLVRGVQKGDRLGVWSPNRFEWVVLQYACARMGAILVNVNPAYRVHELEYALRHSGVSTLVLARAFRQADYVGMVREVRLRCPELRQTIVIDDEWTDLRHEALRLSEDELSRLERELQFDEAINLQYTSGTTGFPKGATLSHHNILNNGYFVGEYLRYTEEDRVCIPVPFYHCFGMVMGNLACTSHGATMVIPAESFDAHAVMRTVAEERCTSLYGVPTMFIAELEHPEFASFDFSSPAHRHHGRLALPDRGDEAGSEGHAHAGGHDLLRHDRDLAGVHAVARGRSARQARRDRRPDPPARRDQDRRSDHGARRPARHAGRAVHARLLGDARLLERPAGDARARSTPGAGCTPATSPRSTPRAT